MTSYYEHIAELERTDPEVMELGRQLRIAIEAGAGEDEINARFNEAVERKLAGKVALCVACADTADPVTGVELAATNPAVGPLHNECVQARARAAYRGRCVCGAKRRPGAVQAPFGSRGRAWIPCLRCLGTIRQVR